MSFLDKIFNKDEQSEDVKEKESVEEQSKSSKDKPAKKTKSAKPAGLGIFQKSILKKPIISEKSRDMSLEGKYVFMVDQKANKKMVQHEVENRWDVTVESVNTMITQKRPKRVPGKRQMGAGKVQKKAIVTLSEGDQIDIFPA